MPHIMPSVLTDLLTLTFQMNTHIHTSLADGCNLMMTARSAETYSFYW